MNEQDWENFLNIPPAESVEFEPVFTPVIEPAVKLEDDKVPYRDDVVKVRYLATPKTTKAARFFITARQGEGSYGFWIPKSAIIDFDNRTGTLLHEDWFTPKEILWGEQ